METYFDMIVESFRRRGYKATLGELLEDGRYTFAHTFTARISELRQKGYEIKCERAKIPSDNVYIMIPPKDKYVTDFSFSPDGQGELFK
jgi:hypothetical protein